MIKKCIYILSGLIITSTAVLSQVGSVANNNWFYVAPTINIATTTNSQQNIESSSTNLNIRESVSSDIPSNTALVIRDIGNKYNLTNTMQNSLVQSSRAYMAIINNTPRNQQEAISLSLRENAANNCLYSRMPNNILDDVTYRLEQSILNDNIKKSSYEYYLSFLNENMQTSNANLSCDDISATDVNNPNSNQNIFNINNMTGVKADESISTKCTVLTSFMKFGSQGMQVYSLQYFLVDNGYMEHMPTSYYGRNTEAAVLLWQKNHGIDQRGYIGPNTRASIARFTCNGDTSKVNAAYNGTYGSSNTVNRVKVVKSVIPETVSQSVTVNGNTSNTANSIINIATTSDTNTNFIASGYNAPTTTSSNSNSLTTVQGVFYTKRNPVNTLYFSYKADISRDIIYFCIEKPSANTCSGYQNFTQVSERYEQGNIDIINNKDRWLFNIYYNSDWNAGGKIYFRNGINNISEVYTVLSRDSI
jgi:peptidoglycan hydrolase-like protein with peptidoglycan-binding domain